MFTLSARGIYGLTAMIELAQAYNKGAIQIKQIAANHSIPRHYLEQLLVTLKKAGFIASLRGSQGGYMMARHPGGVQVLDILTCLDGKLEIAAESNKEGVLGFFWDELEWKTKELLDLSLEELLMRKQKSEKQVSYNI